MADERQKQSAVPARLIGLLQCFQGSLHGDYAALCAIHSEHVDRIHVTMPISATRFLLPVLKLDFPDITVIPTTMPHTYDIMFPLTPSEEGGVSKTLVVSVAGWTHGSVQRIVNTLSYKFDYQMLSMSSDRLFLNAHLPHPRKGVLFLDLLTRVIHKRFSLLSTCPVVTGPLGVTFHTHAIYAAKERVRHGWVMDDFMHSKRSWIVNKWTDLSDRKYQHCPLCYDAFNHDDIVIHLPCQHNYHVACEVQNQAGGLLAWLRQGNGTCPCCRELIFTIE